MKIGLGLSIGVQLAGGGGPLVAYDQFTDANGTSLDAHTPNRGGAWTVNHGAYDIQSNRANHVSNGANSFAMATVQSGLADATVSAIVNPVSAGTFAGLVVRLTDIDNCYIVYLDVLGQRVRILKREAGAFAVLASTAMTLVAGTDYALEVTLSGNTITATVDGANTVTTTNAFNNTATRHGLYGQNPGTTFDEYQVLRP